MVFSIIIPTYNRNDLLEKCLERLQNQQFEKSQYEVIISDDGEQAVKLKVRFPEFKFVSGPRKGPAANRNNGAKVARGEWLVFTDDDCLPDNKFLKYYFEAISKFEIIKAFEGSVLPERAYNPNIEECPVNEKGGCFWSANICVEKRIFNQMSGFDENYPDAALEDQDLYLRLNKIMNVLFVKEAVVIHPVRNTNFYFKIIKIPNQARTWAYHGIKHSKHFGFSGKSDVLLDSIIFFSKDFIRQIKKHNYNVSAHRFIYLVIGIPLLIYFLCLNEIKSKRT